MEFSNEIFLGNINYLLQAQDKRTGKFETDAGVKPGYMARMSRESKPGIDFIMNAAEILGVTVDSILKVNIAELNPTEKYLFDFLDKLKQDTDARKLDWKSESADFFNRFDSNRNGESWYPLLSEETFYVPTECEYPQEVTEVIFKSHTYECNTSVKGPCYNLRLKNGVTFYIMNIGLRWGYNVDIDNSQIFEIWLYNPDTRTSQFITDSGTTSQLAEIVKSVYLSVSEYNRCPKLPESFTYAINAFMQDDMSDDMDDEIPF